MAPGCAIADISAMDIDSKRRSKLKAFLDQPGQTWTAAALSRKVGRGKDYLRDYLSVDEEGRARKRSMSASTWAQIEEIIESGRKSTPVEKLRATHPSAILEVDVRAGAGGGGVPVEYWETDSSGNNIPVEGIRSEWHLPAEITGQLLKAQPQHLRIFEVMGDSMEPRLHEGDRVFIDTRYRFPSPEGIFALWDGYGVVIKRLEIVRGSDPLRYRIISANDSYTTYEATEDEARIIGRYAGRFTAF